MTERTIEDRLRDLEEVVASMLQTAAERPTLEAQHQEFVARIRSRKPKEGR